jgi:hypothetical protein
VPFATDYVLAVWSLKPVENIDALFAEDMLGDDLESWMAESSMLKRTFRNVAVIAGLIERKHPGAHKTGKQVTFSSDLIYDVLRRHEPDHILLRATRADAATGLTDVRRLSDMLPRARPDHVARARPRLAARRSDPARDRPRASRRQRRRYDDRRGRSRAHRGSDGRIAAVATPPLNTRFYHLIPNRCSLMVILGNELVSHVDHVTNIHQKFLRNSLPPPRRRTRLK